MGAAPSRFLEVNETSQTNQTNQTNATWGSTDNCKRVCYSDDCRGTLTNPIPIGHKWEDRGPVGTGCCAYRKNQCNLCCEPLGRGVLVMRLQGQALLQKTHEPATETRGPCVFFCGRKKAQCETHSRQSSKAPLARGSVKVSLAEEDAWASLATETRGPCVLCWHMRGQGAFRWSPKAAFALAASV